MQARQHHTDKRALAGRHFGQWLLCALIALAFVQLSACSSIDCPVQTKVQTNYAILDADGNNTTFADTLYVWSQRSDGTDTLLLNRGVNITSFALPISYQHPEDVLIFCKADTLNTLTVDTVWLKKDDIPHFESVDCSTQFFHILTGIRSTHEAIDSIGISNRSVDFDTERTHLWIRFK